MTVRLVLQYRWAITRVKKSGEEEICSVASVDKKRRKLFGVEGDQLSPEVGVWDCLV